MRKTKIVCTLGPASNEETIIEQLIYAAMGQAFFTLSLGIGALAIFGSN